MRKLVPQSEVHSDAEVTELFLSDSMERQAAWNQLRTTMRQLEVAGLVNPVQRSVLPAGVIARPMRVGESRCMVDGHPCYTRSGVAARIIPEDFDIRSVLLQTHVIDRCSIGHAGLWFAAHGDGAGLLWNIRYGVQHDSNNAVKDALKSAAGGRGWAACVKFTSVNSLPYGKFRTGSWGRQLQETLVSACETLHADHDDFVAATLRQAAIDPWRGQLSQLEWFRLFATLQYALSSPEVVKFARWRSFSSAWRAFRPETYLVKLLLEINARREPTARDSTAVWDVETADAQQGALPGGLLDRCPTYNTDEFVDAMDAFALVASPAETHSATDLVVVKSARDTIAHLMKDIDGGWSRVLVDTLRTMDDTKALANLAGPGLDAARARANTTLVFELALDLTGALASRIWPAANVFPANTVLVLSDDMDQVKHWRDRFVCEWCVVLDWEVLAEGGDRAAQRVLSDIAFRKMPLYRLFYDMCLDSVNDDSRLADVRWISLALNHHLLDEKLPEDLHGHGRDLGRRGRSKVSSLRALQQACMNSGTLEARVGTDHCPQVDVQSVATASWWRYRQDAGSSLRTKCAPDG